MRSCNTIARAWNRKIKPFYDYNMGNFNLSYGKLFAKLFLEKAEIASLASHRQIKIWIVELTKNHRRLWTYTRGWNSSLIKSIYRESPRFASAEFENEGRLTKKVARECVQPFLVTHRRLELRTPWLKVKCSTVWASGSFFATRLLYHNNVVLSTIFF